MLGLLVNVQRLRSLNLHEVMLSDDSPSFIVQRQKLLTGQLNLVTIGTNSLSLIGQQTCQSFLGQEWSSGILTVGRYAWSWRKSGCSLQTVVVKTRLRLFFFKYGHESGV